MNKMGIVHLYHVRDHMNRKGIILLEFQNCIFRIGAFYAVEILSYRAFGVLGLVTVPLK